MQNPILVVNCGSSSIKYALISEENQTRLEGLAENLGTADARIKAKNAQGEKTELTLPQADHKQALAKILELLGDYQPVAVGHRVVHGGRSFTQSVHIDAAVRQEIKRICPLAPLHNPANLQGIEAVTAIYPELPQVAVFDTAFHQSMPEHAYRYAIPTELYEQHHIRRYGFHGTSHAYVSSRADTLEGGNENGWLTAHLGNGCSAAAIYAGKSLDTSMGLTPLEGLVMGTRSGDVDPGLHAHLHRTLGMSLNDIDTMLNKHSGLLALSGLSNDMRSIEEAAAAGNANAKLAIAVFCYRIAKALASLSCAIPNFTGIIFTGGIGENAPEIREQILSHLPYFGIKVDRDKNNQLVRGAEGSFQQANSFVQLWVIPTDEEGRICQETKQVLQL